MLIAFCGCDGSGKSSQVKEISNWLNYNGVNNKILDKWDVLNTNNFPECRFINTSLDDFRVCISEMEGTVSRTLFLFWSINITLSKDNLKDDTVYLLDGYWMKHAAAEIEYGANKNWVENIVSEFPATDLTFYFDVTPEVALKRKGELTPYECGRNKDLSPNDFINHQSKVRNRMLEWSDQFNWNKISSMQDKKQITNIIKESINDVRKVRGS